MGVVRLGQGCMYTDVGWMGMVMGFSYRGLDGDLLWWDGDGSGRLEGRGGVEDRIGQVWLFGCLLIVSVEEDGRNCWCTHTLDADFNLHTCLHSIYISFL